MPTALVTGAPDWVPHVAIALKSEGFEILSAGVDLPPAPDSVDCYVQLPGDLPAKHQPALSDVRAIVADELLTRVDLIGRLAPSLSPSATVVLVGTEPLRPMLELVAQAIVSDRGGVQARVVAGTVPPHEIATLARRSGPRPSWRAYLDVDPDLGFADWRDEVLCLTSGGATG